MSATDLLRNRVVLISGKGGVGRTTVTAALARMAVRTGRRVLVTEIGDPSLEDDESSALAFAFGQQTLRPEPIRLAHNIDGCCLWPRQGHILFLSSILRAEPLVRAALRSKALRKFLITIPSFQEMGIFYHLHTLIRHTTKNRPTYDLIIVDMPATGHTLALTGLPDVLLKLIPHGPIARLLREGQELFHDPKCTSAWIVTTPETLPVTETLELVSGLREGRIAIGGIFLNGLPPDDFSAEEKAAVHEIAQRTPLFGSRLFQGMLASREAHARLRQATDLPIVSLSRATEQGLPLIDRLAAELNTAVTVP